MVGEWHNGFKNLDLSAPRTAVHRLASDLVERLRFLLALQERGAVASFLFGRLAREALLLGRDPRFVVPNLLSEKYYKILLRRFSKRLSS